MKSLKKGFDGYTLKILALIFMTFDHIAYFLTGVIDIPIWFHWIGRVSAPLFIFMVAEGFYHTHYRKKYTLRLYGWSVIMSLGNSLLNAALPHPNGMIIFNNIFATMFVITIYLLAIEWLKKGIKEKNSKTILLSIGLMIIPLILSIVILVLTGSNALFLLRIALLFVPTPLLVEGGIVWVVLGIILYLCRSNKKALGIFYSLFCLFYFLMVSRTGLTYENLFLLNYQWLMILSLPFMLLYNGQRGKGVKHFFYIYYPVHCYVLYGAGVLLSSVK